MKCSYEFGHKILQPRLLCDIGSNKLGMEGSTKTIRISRNSRSSWCDWFF